MKKLNYTLEEVLKQQERYEENERRDPCGIGETVTPFISLSMYQLEKGSYEPMVTKDDFIIFCAGKTSTNNMNLNNQSKLVKLGDYEKGYKENEINIPHKQIIQEYHDRGGDEAVMWYE